MENSKSSKFIAGTRLKKVHRASTSTKSKLAARVRKYQVGPSGEVELGDSNAETTERPSAGRKRQREESHDDEVFTKDHRNLKERSMASIKHAKSGADHHDVTIARKSARRNEDAEDGSAIFAASTRPPTGPGKKLFRGGEGRCKPRPTNSVSGVGEYPHKDVSVGRGATGTEDRTPTARHPMGGPVMGNGSTPSGPKRGARGGTLSDMVETDDGRHGSKGRTSVGSSPHNEVGDGESGGRAEHAEGRGDDTDDSNSDNDSYASDGTNDTNDDITYDNNDDENNSYATHGTSDASNVGTQMRALNPNVDQCWRRCGVIPLLIPRAPTTFSSAVRA
jgi:hypothetical protein